VLQIPLSFDVGGRACGLAFSLALATFYFGYSVLRIATPDRSRFRWTLIQILTWTQWAVLPSLLIWSLNRFSVEPVDNSSWVERTFSGKRAHDASVWEWVLGPDGLAETVTVGSWDKMLRWSTPVFQMSEGFCSLLVIQCAGQITRWLVNRRSDSWMVRLSPYCVRHILIDSLDWTARHVCFSNLELSLLPLESHPVPRNWQRGCHSDWNHHHVCGLPLRLGHWEWKRKPCGKLTPVRLHCSMPLPDLHRLPTYKPSRATSSSRSDCGLSPFPTYNHGILHDPPSGSLSPPLCDTRSFQLHHRCSKHYHALCHHLTRLPPIRPLRLDPHHSRSPRIGSASTVSRSIPRRLGRSRPNTWLAKLVQPQHPDCRLHQPLNAAFCFNE